MVAALILAAGRSSRMGRPKALLRQIQSGRTFASHLIRVAVTADLSPVIVIGRAEDVELRSVVEGEGARFVVNEDADRGQLSSIITGLDAAPDADAVVVMPVDVPLVSSGIVRSLVTAAAEPGVEIARTMHAGRHGHPVLFRRSVFRELRAADHGIGAKEVVRADPARVREVEVGEIGVTLDIDTPEDYLRVFGRKL